MTGEFHVFMIFMAKLSHLSSRSLTEKSPEEQILIKQEAIGIKNEVQMWWLNCPSMLRDLSNDWRRQPRDTKLTVAETLEAEAFSSTKACMYGCILFIHHIINPVGEQPQDLEVQEAIKQVLDIAAETPEGYGLEMGLYYGLFAAGASIFNDWAVEDMVRKKLKADTRIALYVSFALAEMIGEKRGLKLMRYSMRIELWNFWKYSGEDNINMNENLIGGKFNNKWVSRCMFSFIAVGFHFY